MATITENNGDAGADTAAASYSIALGDVFLLDMWLVRVSVVFRTKYLCEYVNSLSKLFEVTK